MRELARLDAIMPLTLEERGALVTLTELAAERGGFVPDQERWLSGWMQCSVRKWRLIRAALIAKGWISESGNKLAVRELPPRVEASLGRLPYEQWNALRKIVFERDGLVCRYCGDTDGPFHCDHVVPISRGGANEMSNLVVACRFCNISKSDRLLSEWRPRCS